MPGAGLLARSGSASGAIDVACPHGAVVGQKHQGNCDPEIGPKNGISGFQDVKKRHRPSRKCPKNGIPRAEIGIEVTIGVYRHDTVTINVARRCGVSTPLERAENGKRPPGLPHKCRFSRENGSQLPLKCPYIEQSRCRISVERRRPELGLRLALQKNQSGRQRDISFFLLKRWSHF